MLAGRETVRLCRAIVQRSTQRSVLRRKTRKSMILKIGSQLSFDAEHIEITLCKRSRKIFSKASIWYRRSLRLRKAQKLLRDNPSLESLFENGGYCIEKLGNVPSEKLFVRPLEAHAFLEAIAYLAPFTKRINPETRATVGLVSTMIPVLPPRINLPHLPADWLVDSPPAEIVEIYELCRDGFPPGTFLRLNGAFSLWLHLPSGSREKPVRELKCALGAIIQNLALALVAVSGGIPSGGKESNK